MKHPQEDELLICDRCGARVALGKYQPLNKAGRAEYCGSDLRKASLEEADRLLADYAGRQALKEDT